jgi:penicillin-binding protein 2
LRDKDRARSITRRAAVLGGVQLLGLTALGARLYGLQVMDSDRYRLLSDSNRINQRWLPPPRGLILDRDGVKVALNRRSYRLLIVAEDTPNIGATLDILSRIIPINEGERARILAEIAAKRKFVPVTVKDELDWEQVNAVEVHAPDLPGVSIELGQSRSYPYGAALAHVAGYVGAPGRDDLETGPAFLSLPGMKVGRNGIERLAEQRLRGRAGTAQVEVNAVGRAIRELSRQEPVPGEDLRLTIDAGLQSFVHERLGRERSATAVVMDAFTGALYALASSPGFDPNRFVSGLSPEDWRQLSTDPATPLIDKAIAGRYAPGSTFKMITALAALESGAVTPDTEVSCTGHISLGGRQFHCWRSTGGHGRIGLERALVESCDIFFYEAGLRCGIDRIAAMARRMGLGEKLGVDLPGEQDGLIPDSEWWAARYGHAWPPGQTVNAAIGQGTVLATPLQLATMTARLVGGGKAVSPVLIAPDHEAEAAGMEAFADLGLRAGNLEVIRAAMDKVPNTQHGTAWSARIAAPGLEMGGKTGTAQVARIIRNARGESVDVNTLPWEQRHHALFVGYAPLSQPRYVCSVVVEHGGGGGAVAGPVARDILLETQRRRPGLADPPVPAPAGGFQGVSSRGRGI